MHPGGWMESRRRNYAEAVESICKDATLTGDYPPSLRSPWRAALAMQRQYFFGNLLGPRR